MKKLFRLSAIVAMLSMMATATVTSSCSDDDDSNTKIQDWSLSTDSIIVKQGMKFTAKQNGIKYDVEVVSASDGAVTLNIDSIEVKLSDDGTSFCSVEKKGMTQSQAETEPENVLMALSPKSKKVISPTKCANQKVKAGAQKTLFLN